MTSSPSRFGFSTSNPSPPYPRTDPSSNVRTFGQRVASSTSAATDVPAMPNADRRPGRSHATAHPPANSAARISPSTMAGLGARAPHQRRFSATAHSSTRTSGASAAAIAGAAHGAGTPRGGVVVVVVAGAAIVVEGASSDWRVSGDGPPVSPMSPTPAIATTTAAAAAGAINQEGKRRSSASGNSCGWSASRPARSCQKSSRWSGTSRRSKSSFTTHLP